MNTVPTKNKFNVEYVPEKIIKDKYLNTYPLLKYLYSDFKLNFL